MSRQRVTRKQMKHDEFVEGVDRAAHWLEANVRTIVGGVVAVLLLALIVLGVRVWRAASREDASRALALGQGALQGALVSADQARPDDLLVPTFASDESRLAGALASFRQAAGATWSPVKPVARLYEAVALERAGDRAAARAILGEIRPRLADVPTLAALAAGFAAELALDDGDFPTAESAYREILDRHPAYPRALAQIGLARAMAGAGKIEEARRALRDVERAESGTGLAEVARVHREALP